MNTLFIFTRSPWARRDMEEWLPRIDEGDGILLMQDAVLALKAPSTEVIEGLAKARKRLFALRADLVARGVAPGAAQALDDAEAVELLTQYRRLLAL